MCIVYLRLFIDDIEIFYYSPGTILYFTTDSRLFHLAVHSTLYIKANNGDASINVNKIISFWQSSGGEAGQHEEECDGERLHPVYSVWGRVWAPGGQSHPLRRLQKCEYCSEVKECKMWGFFAFCFCFLFIITIFFHTIESYFNHERERERREKRGREREIITLKILYSFGVFSGCVHEVWNRHIQ